MSNAINALVKLNPLDEVQSDLVHKLTVFSKMISSRNFTQERVRKEAKAILFSLEEVQGFYEELAKDV